MEDQALPAVLRRPDMLSLQLSADAQQKILHSTQRAGKVVQTHSFACKTAQL